MNVTHGGLRELPRMHKGKPPARGLTTVDTDYGRKIDTDLTWCVNDGACERVTDDQRNYRAA